MAYWRGFALCRRAFKGFNESADPAELDDDLEQAAAPFEVVTVRHPDNVEAKIGASSCIMNLAFLKQAEPEQAGELYRRAVSLLAEVEKAEPDNPRLLWVKGPNLRYAPPQIGGGRDKAVEVYRPGLAASRRGGYAPADPLAPTWGEPELLMNLAWSALNASEPDPDEAERNARAALALVPHWLIVGMLLSGSVILGPDPCASM